MIVRFIMEKIDVDLENCYGIRRLKHQFDFSHRKAYAIYAPNGSMKSSLAETFKNIADGTTPTDRIFPARTSVSKITDENGDPLQQQNVLVLPPMMSFFAIRRRHQLSWSTIHYGRSMKSCMKK